jgi:two-component system sensor histidine kinase ChvG
MAVGTEPREHAGARARAVDESPERGRKVPGLPAVLLRFGRRRLGRFLALSPLTRRILVLNVVALGILVIGLSYLGEYQRNLVQSQLVSLTTQARIFAGALGESAVKGDDEGRLELEPEQGRVLLRRLIEPTRARARLFSNAGALVADSRYLKAPGGFVQVEPLPPPSEEAKLLTLAKRAYDWLLITLPHLGKLPPYPEHPRQRAGDYPEVVKALAGDVASTVYANGPYGLILSVAAPVQRYKRVVGAVMISQDSTEIAAAMRSVRLDILKVFAVALLITTLFSFYLGSTIVRPLRRLAQAAERIGPDKSRRVEIPDFSARGDEIGDLSATLRRMTDLLSQRMEAIERFAADVAHEIKNPLSSLRSAVETAARVKDPEAQRQLMGIILQDVQRLDRLISDISAASRLDAELSRGDAESVEVGELLATLVEVHDTDRPGAPRLELEMMSNAPLRVRGIEGRLAQVFRNLIENAISFSPAGGVITLSTRRDGDKVEVIVADEGPGLPEGKLEAIFERFYTERPAGEKFGIHSGLGLSISKQIVEAHGGTIRAENRRGPAGKVRGARFIVRLPLEQAPRQTRD